MPPDRYRTPSAAEGPRSSEVDYLFGGVLMVRVVVPEVVHGREEDAFVFLIADVVEQFGGGGPRH
jgi:hypothetical protein